MAAEDRDCVAEFCKKADNLDEEMSEIAELLEDFEDLIEVSSITLAELDSRYAPQELGKTEAELREREVNLFSLWEELMNMEDELKMKDKTLMEIYNDIRNLPSKLASPERQERTKQLWEEMKRLEIDSDDSDDSEDSEDEAEWERMIPEEFKCPRFLGSEEFRKEYEAVINKLKNKKKELNNKVDVARITIEDLALTTDASKLSVQKELQAIAQELKRLQEQLTGARGQQQQDVSAAAVATLAENLEATKISNCEE